MSKREGESSSFIGQVIGCLISPQSSLKSIMEKPILFRATVLILVIAVIAAWASYNYTGKLPLAFIPEKETGPFAGPGVSPEQIRQASMIVSAMMGLFGVFGSWLISSAIIHVLSKRQGGRGSFKDMLTLAGYASTPLLIQHLLRLIDSFMVTEQGALQLLALAQVFNQPLLNAVANSVINTFSIFKLWSIGLFVIVICEKYGISTARSIVTVAVTYIIIMFLPF